MDACSAARASSTRLAFNNSRYSVNCAAEKVGSRLVAAVRSWMPASRSWSTNIAAEPRKYSATAPESSESGEHLAGEFAFQRRGDAEQIGESQALQAVAQGENENRFEELVGTQVVFDRPRNRVRQPRVLLAEARPKVQRKEEGALAKLRLGDFALDDFAVFGLDRDGGRRGAEILAAEEHPQHAGIEILQGERQSSTRPEYRPRIRWRAIACNRGSGSSS